MVRRIILDRKLALERNILMSVEKPARYIGNEINMVKKDLNDIDIRFCMCFPDVYEIGMSHLGIQILYDMFNKRDDTYCERVYSPWKDLDEIMRRENIPLFALESQQPVKDFDFLGITLQYEMCYTNVLQVLDLSQIPLFAADRGNDDPIVIGGGPCSYNPEPLADFFDIFYIGEGETVYDELLDLYKDMRNKDYDRHEFLRKAAMIEGLYVPSLYSVEYDANGLISSFEPIYEELPHKIRKQAATDLEEYYPKNPLVPYIKVTQDRAVLEIMRGCIRGCRFCQAGMIYRPLRERNADYLKSLAGEMIDSTGYEEISLSSLSSSDCSCIKEMVYYLIDEFSDKKVNISLPSLRIDAFSLDVMSKVQDIRKSSLTFAPEAGSQRMRDVINKGLTEEIILSGAMDAFKSGWNRVKLYFMLGLPTETYDDIEAIAKLAESIAEEYYTIPKEERNGKVNIVVSTSLFVPKPFTPFQWVSMNKAEEFTDKKGFLMSKIKEQLNQKSIKYNCHDSEVSVLEGVFARGDRRCAKVIYSAYKKGCMFDSWSEFFDAGKWEEAFLENDIDPSFYTARERSTGEMLPWDFIDIGVTKEFLIREYENSKKAVVTPNCKEKCSGCGASSYLKGGCRF